MTKESIVGANPNFFCEIIAQLIHSLTLLLLVTEPILRQRRYYDISVFHFINANFHLIP